MVNLEENYYIDRIDDGMIYSTLLNTWRGWNETHLTSMEKAKKVEQIIRSHIMFIGIFISIRL